jgi:arsenite methyltransferase
MSRVGRERWFALASLAVALLACYGTLALIGLLSVLGVSIAVDATAWGGAIVLFAGLTVCGIALGWRRHRRPAPVALALLGLALIAWAMFDRYDRITEIAGFALLFAATAWDWRLRRQGLSCVTSPTVGSLARHDELNSR